MNCYNEYLNDGIAAHSPDVDVGFRLGDVAVSAQADDTWHNVYHSLKRFFTGKPSATPVVHHHRRRSEDAGENRAFENSVTRGAECSPSPGASATPRVVILPATSPTAETTPGTENRSGTGVGRKAGRHAEWAAFVPGRTNRSSNPVVLPLQWPELGTTTSD